jgi:hypothetical protein
MGERTNSIGTNQVHSEVASIPQRTRCTAPVLGYVQKHRYAFHNESIAIKARAAESKPRHFVGFYHHRNANQS